MKASKLNLRITINIGNYENVQLECEFTPKTENISQEMTNADKELRAAAAALIAERENERKAAAAAAAAAKTESGKEKLTMKHPQLQNIVKRMESGVSIDKVLEYYEPDAEVMNVLKLCTKLNTNNN